MRQVALQTGQVISEEVINKNVKQADSWNKATSAVFGMSTAVGNLIADMVHLDAVADAATTTATQLTNSVNKNAAQRKEKDSSWLMNLPSYLIPKMAMDAILGPLVKPQGTWDAPASSRSAGGKIGGLLGGATAPAERAASGMSGSAGQLFARLESKYSLPAGLMDSVWKQESNRGDPRFMVSPKGAKGHFGFMDPTAKQYGVTDPNDLEQSADGSARMWRDLMNKYGGDLSKASMAYNWGQGNLDRKGAERAPAESRAYADAMVKGTGGAGAAPTINLVVSNVPAGMTVKLAQTSPNNIGLAFAPGSAN
jgi:soluble lytic murein transglycosylase-like protein